MVVGLAKKITLFKIRLHICRSVSNIVYIVSIVLYSNEIETKIV